MGDELDLFHRWDHDGTELLARPNGFPVPGAAFRDALSPHPEVTARQMPTFSPRRR